MPETATTMSIGELAERAGVPVSTIRTWEQRYGLPAPARSPGGHRRYGEDDLRRIVAVRVLVDEGATVAAAARRVAETSPPLGRSPGRRARRGSGDSPVLSAALDAAALEAAYRATRSLLRIRAGREAVEILTDLVTELGGDVVAAEDAGPEALPLDLSLGEQPPLLPTAEPYSLARLHLERVLPTVLDDARHIVLMTRHREVGAGNRKRRR